MFTFKIHFTVAAVSGAAIVHARCHTAALEAFAQQWPGTSVEFITLTSERA